jgi:hypothetical protein
MNTDAPETSVDADFVLNALSGVRVLIRTLLTTARCRRSSAYARMR